MDSLSFDMGVVRRRRDAGAAQPARLNTPRRPQEASGTSGLKSPVNGGVNLSILDGWWAEAYADGNGGTIGDETLEPDADLQDAHDAAALYGLLETSVIPRFFDRDQGGLPRAWIETMKASIPRWSRPSAPTAW